MIDSLTPEQEAQIPVYVDKWIARGTATDRLDPEETTGIINKIQVDIFKEEATPVVIFDNPIEAWVACNLSIDGTPPEKLRDGVVRYFDDKAKGKKRKKLEAFSLPYLCGSFDASIWSFYDFFRTAVGIDFGDTTDHYLAWEATHKLGLIFPMVTAAIVSQKPTAIKFDGNRLHCDGGPAIAYDGLGGFEIHILNGVTVPKWLAEDKSTGIPLDRYNEIQNADQRMEFVKKVGVERMLETGTKLDSYENYDKEWWNKSQYELWDLAHLFQGVPKAPHLKMVNQTTGVFHVEAVSPNALTLESAIKERLGGDYEIYAIS